MNAEIINLRRVRKGKQRADRSSRAAASRALHGRTRSEREIEADERHRMTRALDGHRLHGATGDDGDASS